jgi:hypothetical protein
VQKTESIHTLTIAVAFTNKLEQIGFSGLDKNYITPCGHPTQTETKPASPIFLEFIHSKALISTRLHSSRLLDVLQTTTAAVCSVVGRPSFQPQVAPQVPNIGVATCHPPGTISLLYSACFSTAFLCRSHLSSQNHYIILDVTDKIIDRFSQQSASPTSIHHHGPHNLKVI